MSHPRAAFSPSRLPGSAVFEVRVRSAGDVDAELLGWLRAAYDAGV